MSSTNQNLSNVNENNFPVNFNAFEREPLSFTESSRDFEETSNTSLSSKSEETDPFGLPIHLTANFQVTPKFGNDPFEDSFNGGMGNDAWDPFNSKDDFPPKKASNDPWVSVHTFC